MQSDTLLTDNAMTRQSVCFASSDVEEVLAFIRSSFSEIKEGIWVAEVSGGDGVNVLVCIRPDRVLAAVLDQLRKTDPLSRN
jgi:hypothetical protein